MSATETAKAPEEVTKAAEETSKTAEESKKSPEKAEKSGEEASKSADGSPTKKPEVLSQALQHLAAGKRNLLVQDVPNAVSSLAEACRYLI